MTAGKKNCAGILACLMLGGVLLMTSCAAPLIPLSLSALAGGAQLAMTGGDLYKKMKKADERKAFEVPFDQTWDNTLQVLKDLSLETSKAAKNEEGDGGLIQVKTQHSKFHIAVLEVSEKVSEVGIWAKKDQSLAALIMDRIGEVMSGTSEGVLTRKEDVWYGRKNTSP